MNTKKVTEVRLAGRFVLAVIMILLVVPVHELLAKDGYKEITGTIIIDNVKEGITLDIIVEETPEEVKDNIEVADKGILNVIPEEKRDGRITAFLISGPKNGKLLFNSDMSFTYIPKTGFAGKDSFVYIVNNGQEENIEADVSIKVKDVPGDPEKKEISYKINNKVTDKSVNNNNIYSDKNTAPKKLSIEIAKVELKANNSDSKKRLKTVLHGKEGKSCSSESNNNNKTSAMNPKNFDKPELAGEEDNDSDIKEETPKTLEEIKEKLSTRQKKMLKASAPKVNNEEEEEGAASKTAFLLKGTKNGKLLFNSDASFNYIPKTGFKGKDRFQYKVIKGENVEIVTAIIMVSGTEADPKIKYKLKKGGNNNE